MNLNEINFSFGGKHCLDDYGCIYVEKKGHILTPSIERNAYEISGADGTLLLPGEVRPPFELSGTLYMLNEPPNQREAQKRLREIAAWLTNGRQRLIFDYEPERYYLAEVCESMTWTLADWFGGGLEIKMEVQPYAYNVRADTAARNISGTTAALGIIVQTGCAAPLELSVTNTGSAPITKVAIGVEDRLVSLARGLHLASGQTLDISMEPPIDAKLSDGSSALQYAEAFDYIALDRGSHIINVSVAYGTGKVGARIAASARGRY